MARRAPTPPAPDVGERIQQRRNALGLSREYVAARIAIGTGASTTTNTVGRWEKTGRLTVGELRIVAEILDIDVEELLADHPTSNGANTSPGDHPAATQGPDAPAVEDAPEQRPRGQTRRARRRPPGPAPDG